MFDVAQIERALKDADRMIAILYNGGGDIGHSVDATRSEITAALINLRKVPSQAEPTREEIAIAVCATHKPPCPWDDLSGRCSACNTAVDRILALFGRQP